MQTPMATANPSVDSHHAAKIACQSRTVALVSYTVGIHNNELRKKGWAKSGKRFKLKADIQKIFVHQKVIQIGLFSQMGNMVHRLSHSSGGSHPTLEDIFQGIITELSLTHIQVWANAPYVALIDRTC